MPYAELGRIIKNARSVVFFGGAGVSTESGIPDFRSAGGLYSQKYKYPPETMLSYYFFMSEPEEFFKFYIDNMLYLDAQPNACHCKLTELERNGPLKAVVTQNIDGLHQAAGSRNVLEVHGSVHRNFCMKCGKAYGVDKILNSRVKHINNSPAGPGTENDPGQKFTPFCDCGGIIKPDVVLYGEAPDAETMSRSAAHIRAADALIIGGTSLGVYPAAGLCAYFRGDYLVLINKTATPYDSEASLIIRDNIGEVFAGINTYVNDD